MWILILFCDNTLNALTNPKSSLGSPCPTCLVPWVSLWHNSHTQLLAHSAWHTAWSSHIPCLHLPLYKPALDPLHLLFPLPGASASRQPKAGPSIHSLLSYRELYLECHSHHLILVFYHSIYGDPVSYYVFLFICDSQRQVIASLPLFCLGWTFALPKDIPLRARQWRTLHFLLDVVDLGWLEYLANKAHSSSDILP